LGTGREEKGIEADASKFSTFLYCEDKGIGEKEKYYVLEIGKDNNVARYVDYLFTDSFNIKMR